MKAYIGHRAGPAPFIKTIKTPEEWKALFGTPAPEMLHVRRKSDKRPAPVLLWPMPMTPEQNASIRALTEARNLLQARAVRHEKAFKKNKKVARAVSADEARLCADEIDCLIRQQQTEGKNNA